MAGETLGNTLYPGVSLERLLEMRHTESQNVRCEALGAFGVTWCFSWCLQRVAG